jgi:hypothetical protein
VYAATAPVYLTGPQSTELTFSSTGYQTVATGATNGTRVYGIMVTSTDTSTAHVMTCQVLTASAGTVGMSVGVNIPASSGIVATNPAVNILPYFVGALTQDTAYNNYLSLSSGQILQCNYATALSTGALYIYAPYSNY